MRSHVLPRLGSGANGLGSLSEAQRSYWPAESSTTAVREAGKGTVMTELLGFHHNEDESEQERGEGVSE
jgi:hypothetical protein